MDKTYSDLSRLEREALSMFLAGDHNVLRALREQLSTCRVVDRELTGVGFFTKLAVPESAAKAGIDNGTLTFADVTAEIEDLEHGAGFVLFVRDGRLDTLEGYTYDEPWPEVIGAFALDYAQADRPELAALLAGHS